MVTEGELVLLQDEGEYVMRPGDCAAWQAGDPNGHCFLNRTDRAARFLVVGTKAAHEVATYSDVDFVLERQGRRSQLHLPRRHPLDRPAMSCSRYLTEQVPYRFHTHSIRFPSRRFRQPLTHQEIRARSRPASEA